MTRRRLDAEMVRRGLVGSREEAQDAVRAGLVTVGGAPATKATTLVAADAAVHVATLARRFVSRGGEKLRAALDRFGMDPSGLRCLDAGASTGGFTDCLLRAGAAHVIAVDVGYGRLAWELRTDPRVTVLERTNVRDLPALQLPYAADLVVADLSFISLRLAVPALVSVAAPGAEFLVLVKPQFEASPGDVGRGGVVRDPRVWVGAIRQVISAFDDAGAAPLQAMPSPTRGPAGNVEFLLRAREGAEPVPLDLEAAAAEGRGVFA